MILRKLALGVGFSLLLSWPLAADRWTAMDGSAGYQSDTGHTIARSLKKSSSERVVRTARLFEGLPYVWAGVSPVKGFDCSGFVHEVMRLNGYSIPRMADDQFYKSERVSRKDLVAGDMVFFETYLPGPSHVGFYLGNDEFIHASSSGRGVIISKLTSGYYSERFLGGGRPSGYVLGSDEVVAEAPPAATPVRPKEAILTQAELDTPLVIPTPIAP